MCGRVLHEDVANAVPVEIGCPHDLPVADVGGVDIHEAGGMSRPIHEPGADPVGGRMLHEDVANAVPVEVGAPHDLPLADVAGVDIT